MRTKPLFHDWYTHRGPNTRTECHPHTSKKWLDANNEIENLNKQLKNNKTEIENLKNDLTEKIRVTENQLDLIDTLKKELKECLRLNQQSPADVIPKPTMQIDPELRIKERDRIIKELQTIAAWHKLRFDGVLANLNDFRTNQMNGNNFAYDEAAFRALLGQLEDQVKNDTPSREDFCRKIEPEVMQSIRDMVETAIGVEDMKCNTQTSTDMHGVNYHLIDQLFDGTKRRDWQQQPKITVKAEEYYNPTPARQPPGPRPTPPPLTINQTPLSNTIQTMTEYPSSQQQAIQTEATQQETDCEETLKKIFFGDTDPPPFDLQSLLPLIVKSPVTQIIQKIVRKYVDEQKNNPDNGSTQWRTIAEQWIDDDIWELMQYIRSKPGERVPPRVLRPHVTFIAKACVTRIHTKRKMEDDLYKRRIDDIIAKRQRTPTDSSDG